MAFHNRNEELIDDRKRIAITYLKTWFIIDLISILPMNYIIETNDYSSLARIARLPKLYRLVRIFK